jgi:hypothetical protein
MEENNKKYPEGHFIGMWMVIGIAISGLCIPLSIITGNPGFIAIGPAIGVSVGLAIGSGIEAKYQKKYCKENISNVFILNHSFDM